MRGATLMNNRIAMLRKKNGLTLDQMQKETGINRVTISQYERGKREPKLETWKRLADFFKVSVGYVQGISDIKSPKDFDELILNPNINYNSGSLNKAELQYIVDNLDAKIDDQYINTFNSLNHAFLSAPNIGKHEKENYLQIINSLEYPKDKRSLADINKYFITFYELLLLKFSTQDNNSHTERLLTLLDSFHKEQFHEELKHM
ncbi:helix-turn-helix transcriptional regulator [Lactiplantibacillus plantarum]|nr:XRE family transcriptional regulator [Lactiplantibacillus plantarum]MBF9192425.1 helix-turn-helix transcriptional regulator [Lactiplantibacillus plantarum]MBG1238705.1 helix-turn-helix transcriptional regulator [Lactiplantibacillus plantarum subsp. plantarum]MCT3248911.1 XRE family transcriptional regulator [Lactiplantibacillus plantarum]